MSFTGIARPFNGTILDSEDAKTKAVLHEDKVFKLALLAVALCVLTITGLLMCIACYKHRRRRTLAYLTTARSEVREVVLTYNNSSLNLLGKEEGLTDDSRIYYIFSNPVLEEGHAAIRKASRHTPLTLRDYVKDPEGGIALNPPIFHMQLKHQPPGDAKYSH